MWDMLFGWVGLPLLLDLFHKLHVDAAANQAYERIKQMGKEFYERHDRQIKLWLIKPLRWFHAIWMIALFLVGAASLAMAYGTNGQSSKFIWLGLETIAIAAHLIMFLSLPAAAIYKRDANGDLVRYPEFILDDNGQPLMVEIDGEMQPQPDPFAGQLELDDRSRINLSRVSPVTSMNVTTIVGVITSISLMMLCKDTGNQGFLALSLIVGLPSLFTFEIFFRLLNWVLVKMVRMVEGSGGYVFTQLAVLLPGIKQGDLKDGIADGLIPEEKLLPFYLKVRNALLEMYFSFLYALILVSSPEMFSFTVKALSLLTISGFLMSLVGFGQLVWGRKQQFYKFVFSVLTPVAIAKIFLEKFYPDTLVQIKAHIAAMFGGVFYLLGFVTHPCEHVVSSKWLAVGLFALVIWIGTKVGVKWYQIRKDEENRAAFITMSTIMVIIGCFAVVTGIGAWSKFDAKYCAPVVEASAPAASASVKPTEDTAKADEEKAVEAKKAEENAQLQALMVKQMSDQVELAMTYLGNIGGKIMQNNKERDDADGLSKAQRMKRLDSLTKLRESIVKLDEELKLVTQPISSDGLASLEETQKQLVTDVNALERIRGIIVDGTETFISLPSKSVNTVVAMKRHIDAAIVTLKTLSTSDAKTDEARALAEQQRLAQQTAMKLAQVRPAPAAPQAASQLEDVPPPTRPAVKPAEGKTGFADIDSCESCTPAFKQALADARRQK